jgi:hypothetical protein
MHIVMEKRIVITILILAMTLLFGCQHARLRIAQPLPKSCQAGDIKLCEKDKLNLENKLKNSERKIHEVHQKYYLGGLFPRKYELNESSFCPDSGIYEILQYYTFKDALLEQLTAFIYSPRTVRITCH